MKINVVIKEPDKPAYITEIENKPEAFKKVVGGNIDTIPWFDLDDIVLICNKDGVDKTYFVGLDRSYTVIAVGVAPGAGRVKYISLTGFSLDYMQAALNWFYDDVQDTQQKTPEGRD